MISILTNLFLIEMKSKMKHNFLLVPTEDWFQVPLLTPDLHSQLPSIKWNIICI